MSPHEVEDGGGRHEHRAGRRGGTDRPATGCASSVPRSLKLIRGADSVELKVTVPVDAAPGDDPGPAARPGRGTAAAGLLLRHARTSRSTRRASSSGPGGSRAAAATRWSSSGPSSPRTCPRAAAPGRLQRRGRRAARRLRVLGVVQGPRRPATRSATPCSATVPLRRLFSKTPARVLRGRMRRTASPSTTSSPLGPDVPAQVPVRRASSARRKRTDPADRRRAVALPGRLADPRAVDEVPARRGVPGRRRDAGLPVERGVDLEGEQQTKTKTALEFYAGGSAPSGGLTNPG